MPSKLISANAFICEKVLIEHDGVPSAIRMVETFSVMVIPDIPLDKQGPSMVLYASGKLPPEDKDEHSVEFVLVRPDGTQKTITGPPNSKMTSNIPGFPGGFGIALQLVVAPTQMGLHHFLVKFDGEEVRKVPFMLTFQTTASVQ